MSTRSKPPAETYSAREFVARAVDGHTVTSVSAGSGVPYSTLFAHCQAGSVRNLSVKNAKLLEQWSEGRISAAKTLGLA